MSKPNILFLLIDGLRADKFYGNTKTSKTQNLDSLIRKGTYFEQAISPADGTFLTLNSIFNSVFPFVTGVRTRKLVFTQSNYLMNLINFGYHLYGIVPQLTSLNSLIKLFENENNAYSAEPPNVLHLHDGLGRQIVDMLEFKKMIEPWFYYVHINDLHWPLEVPSQYDSTNFGISKYEKIISSIDYWIGKILEKTDLQNTLVIITSDHGSLIPVGDKEVTYFEPRLNFGSNIGKQIMPKAFSSISYKSIFFLRKIIAKIRLAKANYNLSRYEKRSRLPYFTLSLFDESIRVPLLLVGFGITSKVVKQQVCSVDIFPTIAELIQMSTNNITRIHGKSFRPLLEEKKLDEYPIYLHTIPYEQISPNDKVGIRTSRYKYFRMSHNPKREIHLYDLKNDPYENINIAKKYPDIITKMEKILIDIQKETNQEKNDSKEEDEDKKIREELKKLGYI